MNDIDIPALVGRLNSALMTSMVTGLSGDANVFVKKADIQQAITALDQLRWRRVAWFKPGIGVEYIEGAEYPDFGIPVIVKSESATGIKYDIHALRKSRGHWSWPAFGVAWLPIPQESSQ